MDFVKLDDDVNEGFILTRPIREEKSTTFGAISPRSDIAIIIKTTDRQTDSVVPLQEER
jgi:hypothetical protein